MEERDIAESICSLAEKTLAELSDMLTPKQKDMLSFRVTKVRSACRIGYLDAIKSSSMELEQAFYEVSEDVYKRIFQ